MKCPPPESFRVENCPIELYGESESKLQLQQAPAGGNSTSDDFTMVNRPLYVMLCWGALIQGSSTLISSGGSSSPVGNQVSITNPTLLPLLNVVVHLHHWAIKFSIANYTLLPLLNSLARPHHQAISFSIANLTLSTLLNFATIHRGRSHRPLCGGRHLHFANF